MFLARKLSCRHSKADSHRSDDGYEIRDQVLALRGLQKAGVVDTDDALLVARKDHVRTQKASSPK
jgi:hypothetical protein